MAAERKGIGSRIRQALTVIGKASDEPEGQADAREARTTGGKGSPRAPAKKTPAKKVPEKKTAAKKTPARTTGTATRPRASTAASTSATTPAAVPARAAGKTAAKATPKKAAPPAKQADGRKAAPTEATGKRTGTTRTQTSQAGTAKAAQSTKNTKSTKSTKSAKSTPRAKGGTSATAAEPPPKRAAAPRAAPASPPPPRRRSTSRTTSSTPAQPKSTSKPAEQINPAPGPPGPPGPPGGPAGSVPAAPPGEEWTLDELAAVRADLEAQATLYQQEIEQAESALAEVQREGGEGAGDDTADAGTKTFEREQEISLANNRRDLLNQVEHALARLNDGTYGRCESCGRPIAKARMQAFPSATLCVECKQREERR